MNLGRAAAPLLAVWLGLGSVAGAARAAEVATEVSAESVGVGESFQVQLSVAADEDTEPTDPKLKISGPAEVRGPSIGSMRSITMHNFSVASQTKVTATWTITAKALGRITVGPGSFQMGGRRVQGETVVVEVTDAAPRRPRRFGRDPFDDFFSRDPFDMMRRGGIRQELPPAPQELLLDRAPDATGFLVARLSQTHAVVGEPVVLTIYAYGSRGAFQEANPVEPSLSNFLTYREVQSSFEEPHYQAEIDGRVFQVAKLRQIVLVPLRPGSLEIGTMTAILSGQGYPPKGNPIGYPVISKPLRLETSLAPAEGQPAEFVEGDVGQFEMSAEVSPTELTEGEYAELLVHIRGQGNLPTRIRLPEDQRWQWQAATTVGDPEAQNGRLQGVRTIKVPLRLLTAGSIDLGTLRWVYFDPHRKAYQWLTAKLPALQVKAKPAPAPNAGANESQRPTAASDSKLGPEVDLEALLRPRETLTNFDGGDPWAPLWPALLATPPAGLGALLLSRGALWFWARRGRAGPRRDTRRADAKQAISALKKTDPGDKALHAQRLRLAVDAVLQVILGKAGRALTASELRRVLAETGVGSTDTEELLELLSALDGLEFGGAEGSTQSLAKGPDLLSRLLQQQRRR